MANSSSSHKSAQPVKKTRPSTKAQLNSTRSPRTNKANILNNMSIAVSTIDPSNVHSKEPESRYTKTCALLMSLGARISPTVSKKTTLLLTTQTAREALTQKVRKAVKRGVKVVDEAWIEECQKQGAAVDTKEWDLTSSCSSMASCRASVSHVEIVDEKDAAGLKWSEGVCFGCSCVCHENHVAGAVTECEWCPVGGCDVNTKNAKATGEGKAS